MTTLSFQYAPTEERPAPAQVRGAPRLLWVEPDDAAIEPGLEMLRRHGFEVERAASAAAAEEAVAHRAPDLVILETALPDADGLMLCRRLSEAGGAPVLVVSASAEPLDRVAGLEFGADDYLGKSVHPLELLARVRALLRRAERAERQAQAGRAPVWRFDAELGYVSSPSGRMVRLSPSDAALLAALAARPGEVLDRATLVSMLHGGEDAAGGRSIDARVARLRRQLAQCDGADQLIHTLRGGGYVFVAAVGASPPARAA